MENNKIDELLSNDNLQIINIGLSSFADTLSNQGIRIVHIDWHPPAEEDQDLINMLDLLRGRD